MQAIDPAAELYRTPPEEFVKRRDALARELRAAGDREAAAAVKRLRKPSRTAWALNRAVAAGPDALEALLAAVRATLDAQGAGGDVRAAIASMRAAVRQLADRAAEAATGAGRPTDGGALVNAVLAVLGRQESFDELCAGRLTDIPEAGGLDFLSSLPAPPESRRVGAAVLSSASGRSGPDSDGGQARARADRSRERARLRVDSARRALHESDTQLKDAEATLHDAEAALRDAEARARRAEAAVRAARSAHAEAQSRAADAAAELRAAELALHAAMVRAGAGNADAPTAPRAAHQDEERVTLRGGG